MEFRRGLWLARRSFLAYAGMVALGVASVADYDYSPALNRLGGVWTPSRLDLWLSDTQKMAPGSKMYLKQEDADQRHLNIDYLKSVSGPDGSR